MGADAFSNSASGDDPVHDFHNAIFAALAVCTSMGCKLELQTTRTLPEMVSISSPTSSSKEEEK